MQTLKHAAVSTLALFGVETASAASFSCDKASTAVEKSICANQAVSELDEHLGRYYSAARAALGTGKSCLAQDQKVWLNTRNACKDAQCLKRVYLDRLAVLDALQPGMTAVKNISLPRVDTLMWIIPAAEDTVAAPPAPASAPPFVVRGEIVGDIETGDGFVIRDASGRKHPILLLMFMEKASSVALESLIGAPGVYEARGRAEKAADGSTHFSPGACTFVYRLAANAGDASAHSPGKVQPDPTIPCSNANFKPHELCFGTPSDGVARTEFLSESFYAVILKTAERCTIPEAERLQAQGRFPKSKVFSMRFNCDENIEENISYTNVNDKFGFLAVHAGRTVEEAQARLAEVKATGKFPGANIRKMQAKLAYP